MTDFKLLQPAKVLLESDWREVGSDNDFNLSLPAKALYHVQMEKMIDLRKHRVHITKKKLLSIYISTWPMKVILVGITNEINPHLPKAEAPIFATEVAIVTFESVVWSTEHDKLNCFTKSNRIYDRLLKKAELLTDVTYLYS